MTLRDRWIKTVRVRADRLARHPLNPNTHPDDQRAAMRGVFTQLGQTAALLAVERNEAYQLFDGELRADEAADAEVRVDVFDLTDEEVSVALLTHDGVRRLAELHAAHMLLLAETRAPINDAVTSLIELGMAEARASSGAGHAPAARLTPIVDLTSHPRNYRTHPDDQVEHLAESINRNGFYRNVVTARDGTVLSGHGVLQAAAALGLSHVPAVRLDLDPGEPRALAILVGDNEVAHLGEGDDRAFSILLKEVRDASDEGLLGTGYDEAMLANLIYVTRPASEIADFDAAAAWVGMPSYDGGKKPIRLIVLCETEANRAEVVSKLGLTISQTRGPVQSGWYPPRPRNDMKAVRFEAVADVDDDHDEP